MPKIRIKVRTHPPNANLKKQFTSARKYYSTTSLSGKIFGELEIHKMVTMPQKRHGIYTICGHGYMNGHLYLVFESPTATKCCSSCLDILNCTTCGGDVCDHNTCDNPCDRDVYDDSVVDDTRHYLNVMQLGHMFTLPRFRISKSGEFFPLFVVGHRIKPNNCVQYLIRWYGFDAKHDSWENISNVGSTSCVRDYNRLKGLPMAPMIIIK